MKRIILIFLAIFLLNGSCKKNDIDRYYWGSVSALKNGTNWTAKIFADNSTQFTGKFNIATDKYFSSDLPIENLDFQTIPLATGRYRLFKIDYVNQDPGKATSTSTSFAEDGDVGCDQYHVIETDSINNFIQVDAYDPGTKEIRGTFAVKLLIELPKCNPSAPDTLVFTNGVFHTKLLR